MAESKKHLLHVKSSQTISEGKAPKLPTPDQLMHGELAINYADNFETISLKNQGNKIVTFSTDTHNDNKFALKSRVEEIDEVISKAINVMNNSCGFNEHIEYVPTSELISGSTSLSEAVDIVAEKSKELDSKIKTLVTVSFKTVAELPESGDVNIIYLVPNMTQGEKNIKDEYIWVEGKWELIGSTQVDLSNYYNKSEIDTKLDEKLATSQFEAEKATLATKADVEKTYAKKADIVDMETTTHAAETYQVKGDYALKTDLTNLATKEEVNSKVSTETYTADKATFALKTEIADMLTKTEASTTYAIKEELGTKADAIRVAEIDEVTSKALNVLNNSCGFDEHGEYAFTHEYLNGATSLVEAIEMLANKIKELHTQP